MLLEPRICVAATVMVAVEKNGDVWWPCVVVSGTGRGDGEDRGQGGRAGANDAHASASHLCSHLSSPPAQPVSPATAPAVGSREVGDAEDAL